MAPRLCVVWGDILLFVSLYFYMQCSCSFSSFGQVEYNCHLPQEVFPDGSD